MYECPEAHETIKWALEECTKARILRGTAEEFHSRLDIYHTGVIKTTNPTAVVVREMIESFSSLAILWKLDEEWRYEQEGRQRRMRVINPLDGVRAGDTDDGDDKDDEAGRGLQGFGSSSDSFSEESHNPDPLGARRPFLLPLLLHPLPRHIAGMTAPSGETRRRTKRLKKTP
jgi:hypothetical protein